MIGRRGWGWKRRYKMHKLVCGYGMWAWEFRVREGGCGGNKHVLEGFIIHTILLYDGFFSS